MIIAVAADNGMVSKHFGHCAGFELITIENNQVVLENHLKNPGHKKGFLPGYLAEKGVNAIVSGGMGGAAIDLFNNNDIEVFVGVAGSVKDVAQMYLNKTLKSTGTICHDHEHHESCGE